MCGIAGILGGVDTDARDTIQRMTEAIRHRGPDGEGHYFDGPVALGHRRLAIIDLSPTGAQPMSSTDGSQMLTYNGELYNYRELRRDLEALGHSFRSESDAEVLLQAVVEWGKNALYRFNGMFAFAIWNRTTQELLLARDRYGIKPLYYTRFDGGSGFAFGSEVKALLAHPKIRATLDKEALLQYFTFQNFFTDVTLFKDIRLLPPGHWMTVKSGEEPVARQYWDFDFRDPVERMSVAEYVDETDRLFRQAVSRQLVSDVEVGAFLSGGMDSGSITALSALALPGIKSFTVGFERHAGEGLEAGFEDERTAAEFMSSLFGTEHYEMVLKSGDMVRIFPDLVRHLEEPRVGQSYPNFFASKLAGKFVKVALSGAGGDEFFAGYPWRYYRAVVNESFEHYIDKYYGFWQRLIPNRLIQSVFAPIWNDVRHVWTRDIFRDMFAHHADTLTGPHDYINHSLYFEAKTFLHGLLVVDDKLSMSHGLETRVPFLDNDLVDFAMKVPVDLKLGNLGKVIELDENEPGPKTQRFFEKTNDGKLILRRAMERYVPPAVTEREKRGFSGPDGAWFRGKSIDFVRDYLYSRSARIYEFFDFTATTSLLDEHLSGRHNRRLLVWSLLNFEQWCREFIPG